MNKQIDEYIENQESPQKEICRRLREIVLKTLPNIEEEMKWGVPSYAKGTFYIVTLKDHVNLGFSMKGLSKEEQERFEGSGKTMKTIRVSSIKEINEDQLVEMLRLVHERKTENKIGDKK
jgi:hypothetical protein